MTGRACKCGHAQRRDDVPQVVGRRNVSAPDIMPPRRQPVQDTRALSAGMAAALHGCCALGGCSFARKQRRRGARARARCRRRRNKPRYGSTPPTYARYRGVPLLSASQRRGLGGESSRRRDHYASWRGSHAFRPVRKFERPSPQLQSAPRSCIEQLQAPLAHRTSSRPQPPLGPSRAVSSAQARSGAQGVTLTAPAACAGKVVCARSASVQQQCAFALTGCIFAAGKHSLGPA